MKKTLILILATGMLSAAVPLLAEETPSMQMDHQMSQKDQCLLYSKKCMSSADSLQERMKKLDAEIKKGTKVYSPEELKKLEDKLKETNDTLDQLLKQ